MPRRSTGESRAPFASSPQDRAVSPSREQLRARSEARRDVYARAKRDLEALAGADDEVIDAEARRYVARWPKHPPDPFNPSDRKRRMKAARALEPGGWAARLLGSIEAPCGYSLHARHLGLPAEAADPEQLYSAANTALWVSAIRRCFSGPLHFRLELSGRRIHCHIIAAHDDGPPELPRGGRVVQPLYDPFGWVAYTMKPNAAYTGANLGRWIKARRRGRLPRLSGVLRVPGRRLWAGETQRSALRVSFAPDPQNAPADRSEIMTPALPAIPDQALERLVTPPFIALPDRSKIKTPAVPAVIVAIADARIGDLIGQTRGKSAKSAGCASLTALLALRSIPDLSYAGRLRLSLQISVRDARSGRSNLADCLAVRPMAERRGGCAARPHLQIPKAPCSTAKRRFWLCSMGCTTPAELTPAPADLIDPPICATARGPPAYPLRRAERRFKRPPCSASQMPAKSARALNLGRSAISRGRFAPRLEDHSMKHPNVRRATRTAARSGMSVALLRFKSQAERDQIMSALNAGQLVLINAPNGQFLAPAPAAPEVL